MMSKRAIVLDFEKKEACDYLYQILHDFDEMYEGKSLGITEAFSSNERYQVTERLIRQRDK